MAYHIIMLLALQCNAMSHLISCKPFTFGWHTAWEKHKSSCSCITLLFGVVYNAIGDVTTVLEEKRRKTHSFLSIYIPFLQFPCLDMKGLFSLLPTKKVLNSYTLLCHCHLPLHYSSSYVRCLLNVKYVPTYSVYMHCTHKFSIRTRRRKAKAKMRNEFSSLSFSLRNITWRIGFPNITWASIVRT